MAPSISGGIDHIHIYASDREAAADWYADMLGMAPDPETALWAKSPSGPLTVADATGNIHLAIFKAEKLKPQSFAFGVSGQEYERWKTHLKDKGLDVAERDHTISWSIYITDPFENSLEFTTYDHAYIQQRR